MNEQEYLESSDPVRMLDWLGVNKTVGYPEERRQRKLRLYVCALARLCRHVIDPRFHHFHETEEEKVERWEHDSLKGEYLSLYNRLVATQPKIVQWSLAVSWPDESALKQAARWQFPQMGLDSPDGLNRRAELVRLVYGNPHRPWVDEQCGKKRTWLTPRATGFKDGPNVLRSAWLTPTVVELAKDVYGSRSWELLPVLADALEDEGCDSVYLLGELRTGRDFVCRGYWPLDLLLGR